MLDGAGRPRARGQLEAGPGQRGSLSPCPPPAWPVVQSHGPRATVSSSGRLWQSMGFPDGSAGKEPTCNAGDARDMGPIPGLGRSPGGGNSSLLCYSCLENPTDRGAWWATVHRVTKSRTRLSTQAHTQHDACGKALLGGFSEVTAKNGSKWVPPTIPIIKTVLGQLAETQLHPWVGTPQLPPVPGPHPHHKLAWEMMALALPAAFPGDPWGPVHSTAQSGCPASCACPLPLAGLLETWSQPTPTPDKEPLAVRCALPGLVHLGGPSAFPSHREPPFTPLPWAGHHPGTAVPSLTAVPEAGCYSPPRVTDEKAEETGEEVKQFTSR